jgi:purine-cytosine permease-like protein
MDRILASKIKEQDGQAAVCGIPFGVKAVETVGISIPAWGAVMTISFLYVYRTWKYLNCIMMPVLFLVLGGTIIYAVFFSETGSAAFLPARHPTEPMAHVMGSL